LTLNDFKAFCLDHHIPIITDESLDYIKKLILEKGIKSILEIGTAYGYSAICFSSENTHVDTIEYDEERFSEAIKWVKEFNANVTVIQADAKTYEVGDKTYDLIFIDGAKASYQRFFDKYKKYLNPDGLIVCDNLTFHNLTVDKTKSRSTKNMIKKLEQFRQFLATTDEFETVQLSIGDGLSISKRVK